MQSIGIIEQSRAASANGNGSAPSSYPANVSGILNRLNAAGTRNGQNGKLVSGQSKAAPVSEPAIVDESDASDELKTRFQAGLIGHARQESSLVDVVAEMIGADVTRDTAIEWGIEAGLSDSYVRATVSRLYTSLTGQRLKKVGGGRKANNGAAGFAERAMRASGDDIGKAKALLLAARRLLERWEAAGTVEQNLKALRSKASK